MDHSAGVCSETGERGKRSSMTVSTRVIRSRKSPIFAERDRNVTMIVTTTAIVGIESLRLI